MLVPYCAKPTWCKWRHTVDCVECGACEVGNACLMVRDSGMEAVLLDIEGAACYEL